MSVCSLHSHLFSDMVNKRWYAVAVFAVKSPFFFFFKFYLYLIPIIPNKCTNFHMVLPRNISVMSGQSNFLNPNCFLLNGFVACRVAWLFRLALANIYILDSFSHNATVLTESIFQPGTWKSCRSLWRSGAGVHGERTETEGEDTGSRR